MRPLQLLRNARRAIGDFVWRHYEQNLGRHRHLLAILSDFNRGDLAAARAKYTSEKYQAALIQRYGVGCASLAKKLFEAIEKTPYLPFDFVARGFEEKTIACFHDLLTSAEAFEHPLAGFYGPYLVAEIYLYFSGTHPNAATREAAHKKFLTATKLAFEHVTEVFQHLFLNLLLAKHHYLKALEHTRQKNINDAMQEIVLATKHFEDALRFYTQLQNSPAELDQDFSLLGIKLFTFYSLLIKQRVATYAQRLKDSSHKNILLFIYLLGVKFVRENPQPPKTLALTLADAPVSAALRAGLAPLATIHANTKPEEVRRIYSQWRQKITPYGLNEQQARLYVQTFSEFLLKDLLKEGKAIEAIKLILRLLRIHEISPLQETFIQKLTAAAQQCLAQLYERALSEQPLKFEKLTAALVARMDSLKPLVQEYQTKLRRPCEPQDQPKQPQAAAPAEREPTCASLSDDADTGASEESRSEEVGSEGSLPDQQSLGSDIADDTPSFDHVAAAPTQAGSAIPAKRFSAAAPAFVSTLQKLVSAGLTQSLTAIPLGNLLEVLKKIAGSGENLAFVVGGYLRDAALKTLETANDIDIITNAEEATLTTLFGDQLVPSINMPGLFSLQLTAFPKAKIQIFSRPIPSLKEDAKSRVVAMNALYMDQHGIMLDPTGEGLPSILAREIRCIGDNNNALLRSPHLILKLLMFCQTKRLTLSPSLQTFIKETSPESFTPESSMPIFIGFSQFFCNGFAGHRFQLLNDSGALRSLFGFTLRPEHQMKISRLMRAFDEKPLQPGEKRDANDPLQIILLAKLLSGPIEEQMQPVNVKLSTWLEAWLIKALKNSCFAYLIKEPIFPKFVGTFCSKYSAHRQPSTTASTGFLAPARRTKLLPRALPLVPPGQKTALSPR